MESWIVISLILCTFGFLKELRPSEPFVTDYIIDYKNVTAEEVIHIAFPISTYTSLGSLAVILLVTDFLRYKPIVILEGICHVLTWGILTFSTGLTSVIIVEVFYGIAASAELAYSTYIYAQVDGDYYKRVTSQTHSARLAGKFFGGLVAQILVTWNLMNYHQLNYVTLACTATGLIFTLFLPKVKSNKQFYLKSAKISALTHENEPLKVNRENGECVVSSVSIKDSFVELYNDFKSAYRNNYILKWSLWWAIASAGQYQVINYVQALWEKIREEGGTEDELYNGAVKAIHTFLSALLTFGFQYTNMSWKKWGEVTLTLVSVVQGLMLVWMAKTSSLKLAYLSYIIFRTIHPVMIAVASAEVAQKLRKETHGLIFGINMFIALLLQTLLTVIVSDLKGLALDERDQYIVYGICFMILGFLIGGSSLFSKIRTLFTIKEKKDGSFCTKAKRNNEKNIAFSTIPMLTEPNEENSSIAIYTNIDEGENKTDVVTVNIVQADR